MLRCLILLNSDLCNDSIWVMWPIWVSLPTFSTLSMNDNEGKVVQEVDSLCMKCGEQVSLILFFFSFDSLFSLRLADCTRSHTHTHIHQTLTRHCRYLVCLRHVFFIVFLHNYNIGVRNFKMLHQA